MSEKYETVKAAYEAKLAKLEAEAAALRTELAAVRAGVPGGEPAPIEDAPPPVKKNVWNEKIEEPDFDTEGMSLEEIEDRMYGEEEKE